ncbi:MAG TPA: hypothetical protein VHZ51_29240, partial [Ktedonobacteraceae bacterium]|nr:hypothetical protein [Ktedonobacteraceae bacterium]
MNEREKQQSKPTLPQGVSSFHMNRGTLLLAGQSRLCYTPACWGVGVLGCWGVGDETGSVKGNHVETTRAYT